MQRTLEKLNFKIEQIAPYWALGIVLGSAVSVFGKERIHSLFLALQDRQLGLFGIALTALYQRYVPQPWVAGIFGKNGRGFGVLLAATLGVPLYVCGGGTIPLLAEWLRNGMSQGSAVAFMLSGPATKITNLSALKIVFSARHFLFYIAYVILFALASGLTVDLIFRA